MAKTQTRVILLVGLRSEVLGLMPRAHDNLTQGADAFRRQCPVCEQWFSTDNERAVYDTEQCRKRAANKRNYARKAAERSAKNAARQKAQRVRLEKLESILGDDPRINAWGTMSEPWDVFEG